MKRQYDSIVYALFFLSCSIPLLGAVPGERLWDIVANYGMIACTIDSEIDQISITVNNGFSGTFTVLHQIDQKLVTSNSLLDDANSILEGIAGDQAASLSKVCVIASDLDVVSSLVDVASADAQSTYTTIEAFNQLILSKLDVTSSNIDVLSTEISVLDETLEQNFIDTSTTIDLISSELDVALSKADYLNEYVQSQIDVSISQCELVKSSLETVNSKISVINDEVVADFSGTFTMINAIQQKLCTSESKLEELSMTASVDFSGVYTTIDAITLKVCTIESELEEIVSLDDIIESQVAIIDADVTLINQKAITIESILDKTTSDLELIASYAELINDSVACISSNTEFLNSELDAIESQVCIIDSQVDETINLVSAQDVYINSISNTVQTIDSKLAVIDSKLIVLDETICTIESKVDVVSSDLDGIQSQAEFLNSSLMVIASDIDSANSLAEIIERDVCTIDSTLDTVASVLDEAVQKSLTIESQVCSLESTSDLVNSLIAVIDNEVVTAQSKVGVLEDNLLSAFDTACTLESKIEIIDGKADTMLSGLDVLGSELDVLAEDIAETQTILNVIDSKADGINSLSIEIESKVAVLNLSLDLTGVYTALNQLEMTVCTIDSKVDVLGSKIEQANAQIIQDINGTYTILDAIESKVCNIDNQLVTVDSSLDIIQDAFGIPIYDAQLPYTISNPGKYYVADQLSIGGAQNAITVASNNVSLDFFGRTLDGATKTSAAGVLVQAGLSNVSILNGSIRETGSAAILIQSGCENIMMSNMSIIDTNTHGVTVLSSDAIFMEDIRVTNCDHNGIYIAGCTDVVVQESICNSNGDSGTPGHGLYAQDCSRFCVIDSIANNNVDSGFTFTTQNNVTIDQHEIIACKAFQNGANGIFIIDANDSVIEKSICRENTACGIRLHGCLNVQVSNNISADNTQQGVLLASGTSRTTTDCYIADNVLILNASSGNLLEQTGNGPNSILGNFGLATSSLTDFVTDLTFVNQKGIDQGAAFVGSFPTKWHNVAGQT